MRSHLALAPLALLALASALTAADGAKKPRLDLRASPRVAFSPVRVLMTAELVGGDAVEDYHCPGVDWDWGDGTHSFHEADCPPFAPGMELERRFTASHAYVAAGDYHVRVSLRRASRSVAAAQTSVLVRSGLGDGDN
jgi:hypothetical protein